MNLLGAVAGIGSSIAGGLMGRSAAGKAAQQQAEAADRAIKLQKQESRIMREDLQPWKQAGRRSINQLQFLLGTRGINADIMQDAARRYGTIMGDQEAGQGAYGSLVRPFGAQDFETDPGYAFRQEQGREAIENAAAARGMQLSGANLKALQRFNQGLASDEYQRAWQRDADERARLFNMLSGVSGSGLNAAAQTGQFGQASAGRIGDLYAQQGNVRAAGTVGGAQALGGALGNVGNYLQLRSLLRDSSDDGYTPTVQRPPATFGGGQVYQPNMLAVR